MSVDKQIREMIREEIERSLAPLQQAIEDLQNNGVLAQLGNLLGGAGVRRGPGRPRTVKLSASTGRRGGGRRVRAENGANDRGCAIVGCKRPARSKGYCAAHYQKFRNLSKTGRLPASWKPFAGAGSVADVVLPRGRAGAKALAESKK